MASAWRPPITKRRFGCSGSSMPAQLRRAWAPAWRSAGALSAGMQGRCSSGPPGRMERASKSCCQRRWSSPDPIPPEEPDTMQSESFLVIDDDPVEREILAETVKTAFPGGNVQQAADPQEAETLCAENKFDCVLLDFNMPQMDGVSLSRRLRSHAPYLPLVLVTGVGDEVLAANALRS